MTSDDELLDDLDRRLEPVRSTAETWLERFVDSDQHEELTDYQREAVGFAVFTITDELYLARELPPEEWSVDAIEWVLTEPYPEKVVQELDHFKAVPTALAAFFRFLEERGTLEGGGEIAERVLELEHEIITRAADEPSSGATVAALYSAAEQLGVSLADIETVADMEAFLEAIEREDVDIDTSILEGAQTDSPNR